ncbi:MAG: exodeoxyribonuclease VII large subunit, partial [Phycisphaeraceae bacterium]
MARLPFNPDLIPPRESPPAPPAPRGKGDQPVTVTQLALMVKDTLAQGLPVKLRVIGEISNLSDRTHWFFNLKDQGASIRCVCFASNVRRISFPVKDGMEVIATGRIDFYETGGNVQLYVDKLEPVGVGELELKFRALCDELRKLGYFAVERKKALPVMPRCIAVVTSRSAAALQDVINTAGKRWPGCRLLLFDVRVQGAAAAPEITKAINLLSKHGAKLGIDAIILTRGGGSMEDLWAFNERIVAEAIYQCSLPIVAAIGHETDTTVAELVADLRCATPTQAAMTLVPDQRALAHQVDQLSHRLRRMVTGTVTHEKQRLLHVARHAFFRRPDQMYAPIRERLRQLETNLRAALPRLLRERKQQFESLAAKLLTDLPRRVVSETQRLDALARQLESVGPMNVLSRGYTYTLDAAGKVLRSASDAKAGDELTTVLSDGRVKSRIEGGAVGPGDPAG